MWGGIFAICVRRASSVLLWIPSSIASGRSKNLPKVVNEKMLGKRKPPAMRSLRYIMPEDTLTLTEQSRKVGPMKVHQISGGPFHLRLENVKVVFEPSCYGGTGEEVRLGMVMTLDGDLLQRIQEIETSLHQQLNSKAGWNSSVKESDKFEPTFRSKINKERAQLFTEDNESIEWPQSWRGRTINAIVRLGGTYSQSQSCGPLWEVTHVQMQPEVEENPFA